jgi:hypothetical protein
MGAIVILAVPMPADPPSEQMADWTAAVPAQWARWENTGPERHERTAPSWNF